MGTLPATTLIKNIREQLTDNIPDADLVLPDAGGQWRNSVLLEHLNKGKYRLEDLIRKVNENYFQQTGYAGVTLNATTKIYDLPTSPQFLQLASIKVTTPGYQYMNFREVDQYDDEFKQADRDSTSVAGNDVTEMIYAIVGTGKIKFANFPPATLETSIDYIAQLADYTLSINSTSEIMDSWREYMEGYACMLSLARIPTDPRYPFWVKQVEGDEAGRGVLERKVLESVSQRDISGRKYVELFGA